MNTTTRQRNELVRLIIDRLADTDTIGLARDIADELIITADETNRTIDQLTLGDIRREIAISRRVSEIAVLASCRKRLRENASPQ